MPTSPSTSCFYEFGECLSVGSGSARSCSSKSVASSRKSSFVPEPRVAVATRPTSKMPRKLTAIPVSNAEEEMNTEIEQSRTTHECNLSALGLSEVPAAVPASTLHSINLSENTLVSLPATLFKHGSFAVLTELVLSANRLTSLPLSLFYLPKLQVLSVNANSLTSLPFDGVDGTRRDASGRAFLPMIRRIGMESNRLERLPLQLLEWCPTLDELLLAMNETMLDEAVPYERLRRISHPPGKRLVLKVDNRPRFVQQIEKQKWASTLPWLLVELNKIYPDKVLDFLFLGSLRTAQTVTVYHDLDIGYVLTAGRDLEVVIEPWMRQLVLPVDDFPEQTMVPVFEEAFKFIDKARSRKKGVLIHCFAGLSRSVTVAVAYLMHLKGISRDDALALVRQARPAARPNDGFLLQLSVYENMLRKRGIIR